MHQSQYVHCWPLNLSWRVCFLAPAIVLGTQKVQIKHLIMIKKTKWLDHNDWQGPPTAEDPAWIQVDFSEAQTVSGLAITSANDAPERDPENFSLLGSNDGGQTWTLVSKWIGESWDERLERRSFEFNNGFAF